MRPMTRAARRIAAPTGRATRLAPASISARGISTAPAGPDAGSLSKRRA
jgi:hypothetical protein